MSLAMILLTSFGLIVGLGVLYLAWRFVDNQPSEIDPRPRSPSSPPTSPPTTPEDPPVPEDSPEDSEDSQKSRRMHPSTVVALIGMTLGLAAILFVLFFGPSSPLLLGGCAVERHGSADQGAGPGTGGMGETVGLGGGETRRPSGRRISWH